MFLFFFDYLIICIDSHVISKIFKESNKVKKIKENIEGPAHPISERVKCLKADFDIKQRLVFLLPE